MQFVRNVLWSIALVALVLWTPLASADDWFVDQADGHDTNNTGEDFSSPYKTLQKALSVSDPGDRVFVALGTYNVKEPNTTAARTATFNIPQRVEVYGGFLGIASELDPEDADPVNNVTILTGDIGEDDERDEFDDNAYHVVTISSDDDEDLDLTIVDGFTITAGIADGTNEHSIGGGAFVEDSVGFNDDLGPQFRRCKFIGNSSTNAGGGIACVDTGVFVRDCEFRENSTGGSGFGFSVGGGGISGFTAVWAVESTFVDNTCTDERGGAIFTKDVGTIISNCKFYGNTADDAGGAVNNAGTIVNSLFVGNESLSGNGGAVASASEIHGCTFVRNVAGGSHGGLSGGLVTNSIFWDNSDSVTTYDPDELWRARAAPTSSPARRLHLPRMARSMAPISRTCSASGVCANESGKDATLRASRRCARRAGARSELEATVFSSNRSPVSSLAHNAMLCALQSNAGALARCHSTMCVRAQDVFPH